ncbi:hypothetical protein JOQ06_009579 [Pogonophryne albipinna]|uniref:Uncharacterized protein n=1 Tax=Pogonophryne albipinna TaxID=1090488 RepID=A0AAD6BRE4_9TELE|nr:hypothetical protein JOQ06_009579 [Pogonophryne albipinna]
MEECGRSIKEFFMKIPTNKEVEDVLSNGDTNEMGLRILQLLMAHFREDLTGLVRLADPFFTAADVETTLTLPASPRLILLVSGGTGQVTIERWMISLEGRVMRFIGINPERGTKAAQGKVVSKKSGRIVQKKSATVNTHVSVLIKKLMDFEWDFI